MRRAARFLLVAIALLAGCATPPVDVPTPLAAERVATSLATSVHALAERKTNHGRRRAIEERADALGLGAHRRSEWIDWWSLQRNVVIELPGREDGLVYVVAHYDKTDITPFKFVSLLHARRRDQEVSSRLPAVRAPDRFAGVPGDEHGRT